MKTQRKKIKFGFLALIYALTLIPQKQVQANPLAIAIPSAAVATYTALAAITVGSVYVFATVNTPNIPGIAWDSLRVTNVSPTAVSDLARVIEADSSLKVALTGLQSSYNEVIAGIELAYADGATTIDRAPIAAFYSQVQNTCAAFPGVTNCTALATSFDGLLVATANTLEASTFVQGTAQSLSETDVFIVANHQEYANGCNPLDFFNTYNPNYKITHAESAQNDFADNEISILINLVARRGEKKCTARFINNYSSRELRFRVATALEESTAKKLGSLGIGSGPLSFYRGCMSEWRDQINQLSCAQTTKRDLCKEAYERSAFCKKKTGIK